MHNLSDADIADLIENVYGLDEFLHLLELLGRNILADNQVENDSFKIVEKISEFQKKINADFEIVELIPDGLFEGRLIWKLTYKHNLKKIVRLFASNCGFVRDGKFEVDSIFWEVERQNEVVERVGYVRKNPQSCFSLDVPMIYNKIKATGIELFKKALEYHNVYDFGVAFGWDMILMESERVGDEQWRWVIQIEDRYFVIYGIYTEAEGFYIDDVDIEAIAEVRPYKIIKLDYQGI